MLGSRHLHTHGHAHGQGLRRGLPLDAADLDKIVQLPNGGWRYIPQPPLAARSGTDEKPVNGDQTNMIIGIGVA